MQKMRTIGRRDCRFAAFTSRSQRALACLLAVACLSCWGSDRRASMRVARDFAAAAMRGDSAAVRSLVTQETADVLLASLRRDRGDPRMNLDTASARAEYRGRHGDVVNVFVGVLGATGSRDGIIVSMRAGSPPRVVTYGLEPDLQ